MNFAAWWVKPALYLLGAALIAGALAWYHHHVWQQGWDSRDADYQAFKAKVDAEGKAAAAEAVWEDTANELKKEKSDAENTQTRAALAIALNSLRATADSRGSTVPEAPAGAIRPDLVCFDRREYSGALGESLKRLLGRARGLADEGTASTVDLNTGKKWAGAQVCPQ